MKNYTIDVLELFDGAIETSLFFNDGDTGDSELIGVEYSASDVKESVTSILKYLD